MLVLWLWVDCMRALLVLEAYMPAWLAQEDCMQVYMLAWLGQAYMLAWPGQEDCMQAYMLAWQGQEDCMQVWLVPLVCKIVLVDYKLELWCLEQHRQDWVR